MSFQNVSGQEKILRYPERKEISDIQKIMNRMALNSIETEQCLWNFYGKTFQIFRENVFQPRILYSVKTAIKYESRIKIFWDSQYH